MTTYETIVVTTPTLTEAEEKETVETLQGIVHDGGGEIFVTERMGRRRLAYPIQKFEDGVYTRLLFDSEADVPKELDRRVRLSDRFLRHLTVRLDHQWASDAKTDAEQLKERWKEEAVERERREKEEAEKAAEKAAAEAKAAAEGETPGEGDSESPVDASADDERPASEAATSEADPSDKQEG